MLIYRESLRHGVIVIVIYCYRYYCYMIKNYDYSIVIVIIITYQIIIIHTLSIEFDLLNHQFIPLLHVKH